MKKILISGAGFAGLSTTYWMRQLGYDVTIVEAAPAIKRGGTPVNILGRTIDITREMGLLDKIVEQQLHMTGLAFKDTKDVTQRQEWRKEQGDPEYEIERDLLLEMLYDQIKDHSIFIWSDRIVSLEEKGGQMTVSFQNSEPGSFDLVFGCDGVHSNVRKLWFGPETDYVTFLNTYFSISILPELLIPENTTELYSEPGKTIMINAYNGKTDICFAFFSEALDYDYRNEEQMREMIYESFKDAGWRSKELLQKIRHSDSFYFDALCQTRMPSWSKGRVVLVGDAAYCPSPAAGRGGSVAIDGAAALGKAMRKHADLSNAFAEYDAILRPIIEEIQEGVREFGVDMLVPRTAEAIERRNREGFGF